MTDERPRPAPRLLCLQCLTFKDRDQIAHVNARPVCGACIEKMAGLIGTPAFEELKYVFRAQGEPTSAVSTHALEHADLAGTPKALAS